jgi:glycosyltransferase involved in cell wall biosynthesis
MPSLAEEVAMFDRSSRRTLRIAMVGSRGVPATYSGVERSVEELGKRLVRAGHDVTVFCMVGRYDKRIAQYEGMKLQYLPSFPGKHTEMLTHAAISSVAACFGRFDVIHYHACGPSLFAWLPRLVGRATLCTLHGQDWRAPKWSSFASLALKGGEWSACHLASRATCVSRTYQMDLQGRHGVAVNCVPNGVGPISPLPLVAARERFNLSPQEYVIFVGRLTPGKNIHHLLEAYRSVSTEKKLVIVGGGSHTSGYVDQLHRLAGVDKRVILTGPLHGPLLAELWSNAYLFCFPTAHEGMPVALLEALAYGVPPLVSNIPENLEVISDGQGVCGLTFPMGSVLHLADQLRFAINNPDAIARFRVAGPALVADRYSWDWAAERIAAIYLALVNTTHEHTGERRHAA